MPRLTHLGAQGELAPISALVSPGMEVGAGSLSTRLLELKLQVTLEIGCLQHITNISLSRRLSRVTMQFSLTFLGRWGHRLHGPCPLT